MRKISSIVQNGHKILIFCIILCFIISIYGCYQTPKMDIQTPEQALTPIAYDLPTFADDMDYHLLEQALLRNMEYLDRLDPAYIFIYGPHAYTCREVRESQERLLDLIQIMTEPKELNGIIRKEFNVYKAAGRMESGRVLFTGYFEPLYAASPVPDEVYRYPIYGMPDDLIKIDLSMFRKDLEGKTIIARIDGNKVVPYFSKIQIETEGALQERGLEIAWLKDPVDVAFLHIQGSGRLRFPDGETICVGYQTSNGWAYQSIGRYMIEQSYVTPEEMSMQKIREYLSDHPETVDEVLNYNPSYIFFRVLDSDPLGNINVPVTPGRSIALDDKLFPKGGLCFISTERPVLENGEIKEWIPFSRFVLNQDTGGAIKGAGRADLFWGNGLYAELAAGHMKHNGDLYFLIKKPLRAGKN
ncbi:MAG: MltA domain-containing protein [Deltaproteobacteria bacterium]|nr:MltA domain-containing protein [Deltaproteobacteria bacterium]